MHVWPHVTRPVSAEKEQPTSGFQPHGEKQSEGLDEKSMWNPQDRSALSVEATPTDIPAKQIYFTQI